MRTSRTRPTKLATAPIELRFEIALTSAPRSKSSRWMLSLIRCPLSTSDRWKERDLVARLDCGGRLHHVLVHRRPDGPVGREHIVPGAAASAQVVTQRGHCGDAGGQFQILARAAELLAQRGEKEERYFHR